MLTDRAFSQLTSVTKSSGNFASAPCTAMSRLTS
jgi:hypothetical protein